MNNKQQGLEKKPLVNRNTRSSTHYLNLSKKRNISIWPAYLIYIYIYIYMQQKIFHLALSSSFVL